MSSNNLEQESPQTKVKQTPLQFYVSSDTDGLWLVDIEFQPPRLLNHSSLQKQHFKPEEIEHDIGDRTIHDFVTKELEAKHIKQIRPNGKMVFSTKLPFCDWVSTEGIMCVNYAYVKNSKGKYMCKRHFSFGNNK
jgi:hypothetical protein